MAQSRSLGDFGNSLVGTSNTNINFDNGTFYIDVGNNKVGIGKTNPTQTLDISGTLIASALNNCYTSGTSRTLSIGDFCVANANNLLLTLPSSPTIGNYVYVGVLAFSNTVIGRNSANIMSKSEDLTINVANTNVGLTYIDTAIGWKILFL